MELPNFHDGFFDGFRIDDAQGVVYFFLRTLDDKAFTLTLHGVQRMNISEAWEGNIILDLEIREAHTVTLADIEELYHLSPAANNEGVTELAAIRQKELKVMEINPSYGAQALVLFARYEIVESPTK
jgi:hypothetical protein